MGSRKTTTNLKDDSHHLVPGPGTYTRPHLKHHTPHAPNVDLRSVPFFRGADNFRCHPKYGSLHGSVCSTTKVIRPLRDAKVRDFANAVVLDQNVVCFKVLREKILTIGSARNTMETNELGVEYFWNGDTLAPLGFAA